MLVFPPPPQATRLSSEERLQILNSRKANFTIQTTTLVKDFPRRILYHLCPGSRVVARNNHHLSSNQRLPPNTVDPDFFLKVTEWLRSICTADCGTLPTLQHMPQSVAEALGMYKTFNFLGLDSQAARTAQWLAEVFDKCPPNLEEIVAVCNLDRCRCGRGRWAKNNQSDESGNDRNTSQYYYYHHHHHYDNNNNNNTYHQLPHNHYSQLTPAPTSQHVNYNKNNNENAITTPYHLPCTCNVYTRANRGLKIQLLRSTTMWMQRDELPFAVDIAAWIRDNDRFAFERILPKVEHELLHPVRLKGEGSSSNSNSNSSSSSSSSNNDIGSNDDGDGGQDKDEQQKEQPKSKQQQQQQQDHHRQQSQEDPKPLAEKEKEMRLRDARNGYIALTEDEVDEMMGKKKKKKKNNTINNSSSSSSSNKSSVPEQASSSPLANGALMQIASE